MAGNALLGLYRLHDRAAIEGILTMAADSRPAFRATAAWTTQISDPVFLPALEKLARDLYASVRKNASKAMAQIRKLSLIEDGINSPSFETLEEIS